MRSAITSSLAAVLLVIVFAVCSPPAHAFIYNITDLGTLGGWGR